MSIEKMREEFEAAVRRDWPIADFTAVNSATSKDVPATVRYVDRIVQRAWWGWQASRAALVSNDDKVIAQRLREYNHNIHHFDPVSDAFHVLINEAAEALSRGSTACMLSEEVLDAAYWDFDARIKGYAPYRAPAGNHVRAFKTAIYASIEAAGVKVMP